MWFPGPIFWEHWNYEDLTPYLGGTVESLQVAWEFVDLSQPGTYEWGRHGGSNFTVDNVAFARIDLSRTVFTTRTIDIFADTFSRSDPAHTPFLANAEQGQWIGIGLPGYTRSFADDDSLTVAIRDADGITASNVALRWRHDDGGGARSGWASNPMDLSVPLPLSTSDEGTYRVILGKDDGGAEDLTPSGDGLIWRAGTTVQYYVEVTDDAANVDTYPTGATGTPNI